ncbi:MAG: 4,5-dihydroxyphthalate decarboxylase [Actinobacteria bacterium]|nr:4,5-dihydroxyphthalate decarboxylase [Actinomycetota bacterium]
MAANSPDSGHHDLHLTVALSDTDQVRDLASGAIPVPGIQLTCLLLEVEEIFFRFTRHREWEVSELSLAKYCALRSRGDDSLVAIPVFPSRSFRHSAIYVRADGPVDEPSALAGARIGVPEWVVTATVYARALLQHEYGVDPRDVCWVQAGTNQPGRIEALPVDLPPGVEVEPVRDRSLAAMLAAGDLDAIIAPHPPAGFEDGSGSVVRLFSDCPAAEAEYHSRTGIFPIMHVIAVRGDVYERHRWCAANLFAAFLGAKEASVRRLADPNVPRTPLPGGTEAAVDRARRAFGADIWPYGIEPNRRTLDAFLTYSAEQGVCERRLEVEDLFAPETAEFFRV